MLRGMETPPKDTFLYHMCCEIVVTAELLPHLLTLLNLLLYFFTHSLKIHFSSITLWQLIIASNKPPNGNWTSIKKELCSK